MAGEWIAILAVLTFVTSNVFFRRTEAYASPSFINFIRTLVGTVTFLLLCLIFNILFSIFLLPIELWLILCASFLFGQVIGDTSYFYAQKELGTTITMSIAMTFPLFTFILSLIFLNRPFEINLFLSLIFISIGILIIGKTKITSKNYLSNDNGQDLPLKKTLKEFISQASIRAILYSLLAALGWAIGLVMIDFATNEINEITNLEGLSSIIGNVIRFPFALLILSAMVLSENCFQKKRKNMVLQKRNSKIWLILIFASILGTSIGALLYTEAARTAGATVMSLIASASPLFSLPLTYWVNKERITKYGFLGVIITIIGVIIILV